MSAQSNPIAVLISDIHFTVPTLELASTSLYAAFDKAEELGVPLVIAGDTLDSKAIIRGECMNRLIDIFGKYTFSVNSFILIGNHDLINEKGSDHTLRFLEGLTTIINTPTYVAEIDSFLIPYMHNPSALDVIFGAECSRIIMHQGVQTANMGHYQQDKSSLPKYTFSNYRIISGHYHARQDIKCGRARKNAVGLFSYIGNPYTLSFGEANDLPKGFQILHENGLMTHVPLNLRKHVILERSIDSLYERIDNVNTGDLIWLKVSGTYSELEKLNKKEIGARLFGHSNFKLDKIYTDSPKLETSSDKLTGEQIFDSLIDNTNEKKEEKYALKTLWREVLDENG